MPGQQRLAVIAVHTEHGHRVAARRDALDQPSPVGYREHRIAPGHHTGDRTGGQLPLTVSDGGGGQHTDGPPHGGQTSHMKHQGGLHLPDGIHVFAFVPEQIVQRADVAETLVVDLGARIDLGSVGRGNLVVQRTHTRALAALAGKDQSDPARDRGAVGRYHCRMGGVVGDRPQRVE